MTEKEIGEIRRSLRGEKIASQKIYGCYANANGEIISTFEESFNLMPEEEAEKYLALFRKTLSGAIMKNLLEIEFSTEQVEKSEEHALLMNLKNSKLEDEASRTSLFEKMTSSVTMDENYVILLMHNAYDVPFKSRDGHSSDEDSESVFSFFVCAVCPVKQAKSALAYDADSKSFHQKDMGFTVSSPNFGFTFPAFDDRCTNIYNALLYSCDPDDTRENFVTEVFRSKSPTPAAVRSDTFKSVLCEALTEDCSLKVIKNVHKQVCDKIEEHKLAKTPEPLAISKYTVRDVLEDCGVADEKIEAFTKQYDEEFGKGVDLNPGIIIDTKKFELKTPDVIIKVSPDHRDLVQTRIIDGVKYILVRADDGVEVNGINVSIK